MKNFDVLLSDIVEILRRNKGKILLVSTVFAISFFLLKVTTHRSYVIEASFRDKANADAGIKYSMTDLILGSGSDKKDSETISVLKSNKILEALVRKEALQGEIKEEKETEIYDTILENLSVEEAYFNSVKEPVIADAVEKLMLANIEYPGENYKSFRLTFLDDETYQVEGGREGKLDEVYEQADYSFIVARNQEGKLAGSTFSLHLKPLKNVIKDLSLLLNIKIDTDDRSLIRIKYSHPHRFQGTDLVNSLMFVYQEYLEEQHQKVADQQLTYLGRRESEISSSLKGVMEEHAGNLGSDLSSSGFVDSQKELEFLTAQLVMTSQKLMDIQLDEKRLEKVLTHEVAAFDPYRSGASDAAIINDMLHKIREHKMEQEALEIALEENPLFLQALERAQSKVHEFTGISLPTSKQVYVALSKDRQENETALKQLEFVLKEMANEEFEVTSLTAVLTDPISLDKIQKASVSSHAIKDANNRTTKEIERLHEELKVQKEFLITHLAETLKMLELKKSILNEKNSRLQSVMLELSEREASLLEKQLDDYIKARLHTLGIEKKMIQQHQSEIKERLAGIPEKWVQEQLLQQHFRRYEKMVENITGMVESKNISSNLELIQSAPLDYAVAPLHPKRPHLILWSLIGFILGSLFSSFYFVSSSLLNAIPLTLNNLSLNGFNTLGYLKGRKKHGTIKLTENNLNVLRRALGQLPKETRLLLNLYGKGLDCSNSLKELSTKKGFKTLFLDLSFKDTASKVPGLIQFLENKVSLKEIIQNDTILSGGVDTYSNELLSQEAFKEFLSLLKERYDLVIASSSTTLDSAKAESLLELFDATFITIKTESLEEIKPLLTKVKALPSKFIAFFKYN